MSDMDLSLAQIATWLPRARLAGDGAVRVARVHTDTRTLQPRDLFVALRGERFDASTNAWTVSWDLTYRRRAGTR